MLARGALRARDRLVARLRAAGRCRDPPSCGTTPLARLCAAARRARSRAARSGLARLAARRGARRRRAGAALRADRRFGLPSRESIRRAPTPSAGRAGPARRLDAPGLPLRAGSAGSAASVRPRRPSRCESDPDPSAGRGRGAAAGVLRSLHGPGLPDRARGRLHGAGCRVVRDSSAVGAVTRRRAPRPCRSDPPAQRPAVARRAASARSPCSVGPGPPWLPGRSPP